MFLSPFLHHLSCVVCESCDFSCEASHRFFERFQIFTIGRVQTWPNNLLTISGLETGSNSCGVLNHWIPPSPQHCQPTENSQLVDFLSYITIIKNLEKNSFAISHLAYTLRPCPISCFFDVHSWQSLDRNTQRTSMFHVAVADL